jgi:hypothetical protein
LFILRFGSALSITKLKKKKKKKKKDVYLDSWDEKETV